MEHESRQISKDESQRVEKLYEKNRGKLEEYASLLLWWNKKINLVSRDVSRETILLHIKHSLYVSLSDGFVEANHVIDTGAGGGLPSIPLALCFPEKTFVVNDIVVKKVFAVNDIINKLGLAKRARGLASDIRLVDIPEQSVIITKHAFKLDQLFGLSEEKPWKKIVFLKGSEEAVSEWEGIKDKTEMSLVKLDPSFMGPFYDGKGVVEIRRRASE
ncbi:MAG: class I SAM-dependent methyltransferase [Balneola sp.]